MAESQDTRTIFIGPGVTWAMLVREVARAERDGVPLVATGLRARGRKLTERLSKTFPDVIWLQEARTGQWRAIVGWNRQVAIAMRSRPARPA